MTFPSSTREGVIGGLNPNREYTYAISVTVNFNCIVLEGGKTPFIKPGMILKVAHKVMHIKQEEQLYHQVQMLSQV